MYIYIVQDTDFFGMEKAGKKWCMYCKDLLHYYSSGTEKNKLTTNWFCIIVVVGLLEYILLNKRGVVDLVLFAIRYDIELKSVERKSGCQF